MLGEQAKACSTLTGSVNMLGEQAKACSTFIGNPNTSDEHANACSTYIGSLNILDEQANACSTFLGEKKMVECPVCLRDVELSENAREGDVVQCQHCKVWLRISWVNGEWIGEKVPDLAFSN